MCQYCYDVLSANLQVLIAGSAQLHGMLEADFLPVSYILKNGWIWRSQPIFMLLGNYHCIKILVLGVPAVEI